MPLLLVGPILAFVVLEGSSLDGLYRHESGGRWLRQPQILLPDPKMSIHIHLPDTVTLACFKLQAG